MNIIFVVMLATRLVWWPALRNNCNVLGAGAILFGPLLIGQGVQPQVDPSILYTYFASMRVHAKLRLTVYDGDEELLLV
jgi:hypothetical protein